MEEIIRRVAKESQRIQEGFIRKNTSQLIDCAEEVQLMHSILLQNLLIGFY
jgi:hypothetical protein